MWILTGDTPPTPPLISIVIEEKIETPPPKPITWQDNPNQCDQITQWIALESPFYCIDKKIPLTRKVASKPIKNQSNGYVAGNCTWYAKSKRPDLPNNLGNAITWTSRASAQGYSTGSTPQAGAIGQKGNHVIYIESVNSDGTMNISDMNYNNLYEVTYRTISSIGWQFIY